MEKKKPLKQKYKKHKHVSGGNRRYLEFHKDEQDWDNEDYVIVVERDKDG